MVQPIDRRSFLRSMPALAVAPRLLAQSPSTPPIPVRGLNHMTLSVSDPKRSLEFYQGLSGMPVQARQGQTTLLRIGAGPQFLALSGTGANGTPSINHFCMSVESFDASRAMTILAGRGVARADGAGGGLSGGAMKARLRMRGPESGGAPGGTPELYSAIPTASSFSFRTCGTAAGRACSGTCARRRNRRPPRGCSPSAT